MINNNITGTKVSVGSCGSVKKTALIITEIIAKIKTIFTNEIDLMRFFELINKIGRQKRIKKAKINPIDPKI